MGSDNQVDQYFQFVKDVMLVILYASIKNCLPIQGLDNAAVYMIIA